MKKGLTYVFAAAGVLLIIVLLVTSIEAFALNRNFFEKEYAKLGTAADIGMTDEALAETTDVLLAYTAGQKDGLAVTAAIDGEEREVFNQREKDHMVDVRNLYISARRVRNYSLIAVAVLIGLCFLISRRRAPAVILKAYIIVGWVFLAAVAALGVWIAVDFSAFWTTFHRVFFTNELWLLNPITDILIQMVPLKFFYDLVLRITLLFAGTFIATMALCFIGRRFQKKKIQGNDLK